MLAFAVSFFLIVLAVQLNSVKLPAPDPRQGPFWLTDLMFGLYISGLAVPSLKKNLSCWEKSGISSAMSP